MRLQALFDLKERLEHAAIAGTGLLHEDFRLRRAVEALAPLTKANPVFAKIGAGAAALLSAREEERSARLLDVLSLVDAVVYTQGASDISGTLMDLTPGFGCYVQASYGELQPLLTALHGTGSGRTSQIRQYWCDHPNYFSDFRVLPSVIGALGDHYAELADMVGEILLKQGSGILPLLKENFDPAGKTEMVRRVRLIAKLAGEQENEWFVSVLPDSGKDIREAIVQALSLCKDNNRLLIDLCQSERGKLKESALRSLAAMDTEEAGELWRKELRKKPDLVSCLKGVCSTLAADLAAEAVREFLDTLLSGESNCYDQADLARIQLMLGVLNGKYSDRVDSLWRWIAGNMKAFAKIKPDKNVRFCDLSVAGHLQKTLLNTILWNGCPQILRLGKELGDSYGQWFLGCAMVADMAHLSAPELYARYVGYLEDTTLPGKGRSAERMQIMRALAVVRWSPALHGFTVVFPRVDALTGADVTSARRLNGLDPRWMKLLTNSGLHTGGSEYDLMIPDRIRMEGPTLDWLISWLIDGDDPESCAAAGTWLHHWMLETGDMNTHFYDLLRCGWKNWQGVLAHCSGKQGAISYTQIQSLLRLLPVSNQEKAEQLRELDQLAQSNTVKVQFGIWPHESVLRQIAILESDPNAEFE